MIFVRMGSASGFQLKSSVKSPKELRPRGTSYWASQDVQRRESRRKATMIRGLRGLRRRKWSLGEKECGKARYVLPNSRSGLCLE